MNISYYYNYNFVSPESIYAEVKEELKSYFQTGVVDDLMFPRYTEDCLRYLGRSSYKIMETVSCVEDFTCNLPEGFEAVRELWLVSSFEKSYQLPTAIYEQHTTSITPVFDRCDTCTSIAPREVHITCKTTGTVYQKFNVIHLLKPGNIHARNQCSTDSLNPLANPSYIETFDIRDNKIITNFPSGYLYLVYYQKEYDSNEYQLVPDNYKIKTYLKAELKFRVFETIFNNVFDETFNQLMTKLKYYEEQRDIARVAAEIEIKKQTTEQSIRSIKYSRRRFNKYQIT